MNDAISPPALSAVVALRIRDFVRAPVAEQVRLKQRIEAIVQRAIEPIAPDSRIALDASDGIVLVVLAGPDQALEIAARAMAGAGETALLIGVDYGPVRAVEHERRGRGLVGDGLVAATALAGETIPGRIAASRSFREVLDWAAPGRAAELVPSGSFTDARTRVHEMYTWDPGATRRRRRRFVAAGGLAVAAILGTGVAARALLQARRAQPAILEFSIAPRGEVFVDGIAKGASPPLKRLEVSPGARVIEIRASGYPTLKLDVNLIPQQTMTIRHTFVKQSRPHKERSFVDDLRRKLGI